MKFNVNHIYNGDCIEILKKLPPKCVDVIFADPPYNLQLESDLYRPDSSKVNAVNDNWDKFLNFKQYDNFTFSWLKECKRVLKDSGTIWVIGSYHNIYRVGKIIQDLGYWILNDVIWEKSNPMPNFKGVRFTNAHEILIWAKKNKEQKHYTFNYDSMKNFNDDIQMRSVWKIPICSGNERIKENGVKIHSTQKPEQLLYRVILTSTKPGDIVLDPFFGTGTTGYISKLLGRKYIGIEKNVRYIKFAVERIDKIKEIDVENNIKLLSPTRKEKRPKVAFGKLIESKFLKCGDILYNKNKDKKAVIKADASLKCGKFEGSIHKAAAFCSNTEKCNGWTYWYFYDEKKKNYFLIDILRDEYAKIF